MASARLGNNNKGAEPLSPTIRIAQQATEHTPFAETIDTLNQGYGLESHAIFAHDNTKPDGEVLMVTDYHPLKLSTFRVFFATSGTILSDPILFFEQILLTLLFFLCAFPIYMTFSMDLAANRHGDVSVRRWLSTQEDKMRQFAMIMTGLAAFLLSFYTATSVARWWTMRTAGCGGIKAATVNLEWLLYQNVTQDPEILNAVRRYGRASMFLIFIWRQSGLSNLKEMLLNQKVLTEKEIEKLEKVTNGAKHETIWAWQGGIVTMLYNEGKIKSDQLFNTLIQQCTEGRAAVQCVHTHLAVRVPMQYVHVLGLLVKMHNFVLAVIMGALFGVAVRNAQLIVCVQTFARTLILPFLFNAILLINANLADPFSGDDTDFPGAVYQSALEKDCKGFIDATDNFPEWMKERSDKARSNPIWPPPGVSVP